MTGCEVFSIYLIKRKSDGMLYVGISDDVKRRMGAHRSKNGHFHKQPFSYEIIYQSRCLSHIEEMEEHFIEEYNTFASGLNRTKGGKAWGHDSPKFTTRGYKYSDESKEKMSKAAKKRIAENGPNRNYHTEEQKIAWSKSRKGKIHSRKLSDEQIREIRIDYKNKVPLATPFNPLGKTKGVFLNYERAFAHEYGEKFGITLQNCLKIINYVSFKHITV